MSTQTPATRRSTRVASRTNTPAVSQAVFRAQATPARRGRGSRKSTAATRTTSSAANASTNTQSSALSSSADLPPLLVGRSFAYGASGRIDVPTQSTGPEEDLRAVLGDVEGGGNDLRRDTNGAMEQVAGPEEPVEEHVEEPLAEPVVDTVEETNTKLGGTSLSFGNVHEAGALPPQGHSDNFAQPNQRASMNSGGKSSRAHWQSRVARIFSRRNLFYLFVAFLLALNATSNVRHLTDHMRPERLFGQMAADLIERVDKLERRVSNLGLEMHHEMIKFWKNAHHRMEQYDTRAQDAVDRIESGIAILRKDLPDLIVVRPAEDGAFELTDEFWSALNNRTAKEFQKGDLPWDKFIERNEQLLHRMSQNWALSKVDSTVAATVDKYKIIGRDEVMEHIRKIHDQIALLRDHTRHDLDEMVQRAHTQYVRSLGRRFEDSLRVYQFMEMQMMINHQVNFMSPKLGLLIDSGLTSPTFEKKLPWNYRLWSKLTSQPPYNGPLAALQEWKEPGDCWCAAVNARAVATRPRTQLEPEAQRSMPPPDADNKGAAQIGVVLPMEIYPSQVIVEHPSLSTTLEPDTAPRFMELWVDVRNATQRNQVSHAFDIFTWGETEHGEPDNTHTCGPRNGLPESFVCAGKWEYDKYAWNNVQLHTIGVPFKQLDVGVSRAVIRVTETWGKGYTCLYRLRMHGKLVDNAAEDESRT